MNILGIETSCDDTSVALVSRAQDHFVVHKMMTASQVDIHKQYGGVVPEIAGREHANNIVPVLREVLDHATQHDLALDAIAVTAGPGLITSLVVGVETAKGLSLGWDIPIVRTNHIEGHIYSALLGEHAPADIPFPAIALVVSGGHTEIILMKDHGVYELIGKTRDDAAGECFDKVGKLLGFSYPGGPQISQAAVQGNGQAISLPRPMIKDDNYEFSFAGLKTAARYHLEKNPIENESQKHDFCASFEQAIVDVLVAKTLRAAIQYNAAAILLSGGVSANGLLRDTLSQATQELPHTQILIPEMKYTTDNAAMIAAAGYFHASKKEFSSWENLSADPAWELVN